MIRALVYGALLFVSYLLQIRVSVLSSLTGVSPNLLLILVASFALMRGERTGILLGFFAGLFVDLVFGDMLGFYALIYMFLGFLAEQLYLLWVPGQFLLPVALLGVLDLVFGCLCYVMQFLLRSRFHFTFYLRQVILPEAVGTALAAIFLWPLLGAVNAMLEAWEERRAKKFV